jgi:hypothetical protein
VSELLAHFGFAHARTANEQEYADRLVTCYLSQAPAEGRCDLIGYDALTDNLLFDRTSQSSRVQVFGPLHGSETCEEAILV